MPNMSYCMFSNTLGDLEECYDALCDGKELSEEEKRAKEQLILLCSQIADEFGDDE